MSPVTGLDEIETLDEMTDEEVPEGQEGDHEEDEEPQAKEKGEDEREEVKRWANHSGPSAEDGEPTQLPLEKWSEHQLAEAGIELANHMHKLKVYEEGEGKHRRHYKENRDRMADVIDGLRLRIREQRYALGIEETAGASDEEE